MNIKLIKDPSEPEFQRIEVRDLYAGGAYLAELTGSIFIPTGIEERGGKLILIQITPGEDKFQTKGYIPTDTLFLKRVELKDVFIHYANRK